MVENNIVCGYDIPKTIREGKGKSRIIFPSSYCVVDIETTGLNPRWDHIIEIGAIRYVNGEEVGRFQMLVQPPQYKKGRYVDDFIESLTGITNEMLAEAPKADEVISQFDIFLGDDIIVGYNVGFDINFIYDCYCQYLGKPLSNDHVDVMRFSRKLHPEMSHHRLSDMVHLFKVRDVGSHRAIPDVMMTQACFELLCNEAVQRYGTEEAFVDSFRRKYIVHGFKAKDVQGDETKCDRDSPLYNRYCVFTGKLE